MVTTGEPIYLGYSLPLYHPAETSHRFEQHLSRLRDFLARLKKAGLKLNQASAIFEENCSLPGH